MAEPNTRKHTIPDHDDPQDSSILIRRLSNTINDIIPVASATERDQILTALRGEGFNGPVYVDRSDTGVWERYPGTGDAYQRGWEIMGGRQHGATVEFRNSKGQPGDARDQIIRGFVRASAGFNATNDHDISVPVGGMYAVSVHTVWSGAAAELGRTFTQIMVNNSSRVARFGSNNEDSNSGTMLVPLETGSRLRCLCYHEKGGERVVETLMQIIQIGAPNWTTLA